MYINFLCSAIFLHLNFMQIDIINTRILAWYKAKIFPSRAVNWTEKNLMLHCTEELKIHICTAYVSGGPLSSCLIERFCSSAVGYELWPLRRKKIHTCAWMPAQCPHLNRLFWIVYHTQSQSVTLISKCVCLSLGFQIWITVRSNHGELKKIKIIKIKLGGGPLWRVGWC